MNFKPCNLIRRQHLSLVLFLSDVRVYSQSGVGVKKTAKLSMLIASLISIVLGQQPQCAHKILKEFIPAFTRIAEDIPLEVSPELGHHDLAVWQIQQGGLLGNYCAANSAAGNGDLELIQLFRERGIYCTTTGVENAARNGHLEVVRDLREKDNIRCSSAGLSNAAAEGHAHVVRDLLENETFQSSALTGSPGSSAIWWAGFNGNFDIVLDMIHNHNVIPCEATANFAAKHGNMTLLEYLRDKFDVHVTMEAANMAASTGQLEMVRYLRSQYGFHCTASGADSVAKIGHLELMKDLEMHGIYCTNTGILFAAQGGHLDMLSHLIEERQETIDDITKGMVADALAIGDHLEMLDMLWQQGFHCSPYGANSVAKYGNIHVLEFLRERGVHCTYEGADNAARYEQLDVIRYLRTHGIHCSYSGADWAARLGYFDVVKDLAEHDIYPTQTCGLDLAAVSGYTRIVRYLHETGKCKCSQHGVFAAEQANQLYIVQMLQEEFGIEPRPKKRTSINSHSDVLSANGRDMISHVYPGPYCQCVSCRYTDVVAQSMDATCVIC